MEGKHASIQPFPPFQKPHENIDSKLLKYHAGSKSSWPFLKHMILVRIAPLSEMPPSFLTGSR
jgi:hypothetical protein